MSSLKNHDEKILRKLSLASWICGNGWYSTCLRCLLSFISLKKTARRQMHPRIACLFRFPVTPVASVTSVCLFDKKFGLFDTKLTITYNYHLSYICALQQSIYREKRWKREELQVNLLAPDRERERNRTRRCAYLPTRICTSYQVFPTSNGLNAPAAR